MKKLILLSLLCLAFTVNAQTTYVITMGVQNYNNPNNPAESLLNSASDAMTIDSIFKAKGAQTACLTGKYVNVSNINEKLDIVKYKINKNQGRDNLVVFCSTHGSQNGYLLTWDGFYYVGELIRRLSEIKAKNICLFLDDCHSGSAGKIYMEMSPEKRNPALFIFTACRQEESAIDESMLGSAWFSAAVIKGLRGISDSDRNRVITVAELYKYIYDDVVLRCEKKNQALLKKMEGKESEVQLFSMHPQLYGPANKMNEPVISYVK